MRLNPIARYRRERVAAQEEAEEKWREADLKEISPELLDLVHKAVERELASREALNTRLTATITFAGALLALAVTIGQKAGGAFAHNHDMRVIIAVCFTTAVVLLVLTLILSFFALLPEPRHRSNPELYKHYGRKGSEPTEVRADNYKAEVALLAQLGERNDKRATRLLWAQRVLSIALVVAAALAVILFYGSR